MHAPRGMDRGGISSSAAVGVAMLMALQKANGIDPHLDVDAWENILLAQQVENGYLGLHTGVLDQASVGGGGNPAESPESPGSTNPIVGL